MPDASLPFHRAMPSITHMALVELEKAGILKFVISQVRVLHFVIKILCHIPYFSCSGNCNMNLQCSEIFSFL